MIHNFAATCNMAWVIKMLLTVHCLIPEALKILPRMKFFCPRQYEWVYEAPPLSLFAPDLHRHVHTMNQIKRSQNCKKRNISENKISLNIIKEVVCSPTQQKMQTGRFDKMSTFFMIQDLIAKVKGHTCPISVFLHGPVQTAAVSFEHLVSNNL